MIGLNLKERIDFSIVGLVTKTVESALLARRHGEIQSIMERTVAALAESFKGIPDEEFAQFVIDLASEFKLDLFLGRLKEEAQRYFAEQFAKAITEAKGYHFGTELILDLVAEDPESRSQFITNLVGFLR